MIAVSLAYQRIQLFLFLKKFFDVDFDVDGD